MITHCLINRVFAITSNRIGNEAREDDDFKFTGGSQITSFNGDVLSSAPKDKTHTDFVQIDVKKARNKNLNKYNNVIEDRRPEFYSLE
jgi:predicted amidohydrolase